MNSTELADVNVLVAIADEANDDHAAAVAWLREVDQFATTPLTEVGLVRLLLSAKVIDPPLTIERALALLASLKALPKATFVPDSTSLTDARSITAHVTGTKQVTDTHLLNLAIATGCRLATFDGRLRDNLPARHRRHVRVIES